MSLTAEVLRLLVAKGLSAQEILDVAEAMETSKPARSANAERQARFRQRRREGQECDVTTCVTDNITNNVTDNVSSVTFVSLSLPPNDNNSNPPPIPTQDITPAHEGPDDFHVLAWVKFTENRLGKFKQPRRLPEEWAPVLTENAQKTVAGWPPGMFADQLAAFRDNAADKGRVSRDWQAAFRTWITNANRWKPNDRSNANRQRPAGSQNSGGDGLTRALDLVDRALSGRNDGDATRFARSPS